MAEFPAMPLWTDAYLADTRHLSAAEHGAYLLLMMEAWRRPSCSLPDNDALLARLACMSDVEWSAVKENVLAFWTLNSRSKTWQQKRLMKEHEYLQDKRQKNKDAAAKRWNKTENENADGYAKAMPKASQPTPTPTPLKKEPSVPKKGTRIPEDFRPDLDEAVRIGVPMQLVSQEAAKFADYWRGVSGAKGVKLDWPATWRNWCRNAASRLGARSSPAKSNFRDHQDEVTKSFERAANGRDHEQEQPSFLDLGRQDYRRGK